MITMSMFKGDINISESGMAQIVSGTDKLSQDIAEALNSAYSSSKAFGGGLVDMKVSTTDQVKTEIYNVLEKLKSLQSGAEPHEKIKSIREVSVVQVENRIYAYIDVVSYAGDVVSGNYSII